MGDRHKGPRKEIVGVKKIGSYGTTWWLHDLECGHIERRKRKSPLDHIGCASCKQSERLLINVLREEEDPATDMQVEIEASRLRAGLSASLGIPLESVEVNIRMVGRASVITGAMVWLHTEAAKNVAERLDKHHEVD
jgi:hypothetical protein